MQWRCDGWPVALRLSVSLARLTLPAALSRASFEGLLLCGIALAHVRRRWMFPQTIMTLVYAMFIFSAPLGCAFPCLRLTITRPSVKVSTQWEPCPIVGELAVGNLVMGILPLGSVVRLPLRTAFRCRVCMRT